MEFGRGNLSSSSRANAEIYHDTTEPPLWSAEEDRSVIHRFSFNTDAFTAYFGTYNGRCMVLLSTCWFPTYCCNWVCAPYFLRWENHNALVRARSLQLALSKKGILFGMHAHKLVCRWRWCGGSEEGDRTVFIPYEDITRVEFVAIAPSEARCGCGQGCLVKKPMEKVEIYTKRGVSSCRPELVLCFLNDPQDFVDLVQTMMYKPQRLSSPQRPPSLMSMHSPNTNPSSSRSTPSVIGASSSSSRTSKQPSTVIGASSSSDDSRPRRKTSQKFRQPSDDAGAEPRRESSRRSRAGSEKSSSRSRRLSV